MCACGFDEHEKFEYNRAFFIFCAPTEGRQVKRFLKTVQTMASSNAYIQNTHHSLDSESAKRALTETLALTQKAIAQLNEARRVRPEQLNAPITL
jgi:hypothetical protein